MSFRAAFLNRIPSLGLRGTTGASSHTSESAIARSSARTVQRYVLMRYAIIFLCVTVSVYCTLQGGTCSAVGSYFSASKRSASLHHPDLYFEFSLAIA